MSKPKNKQVAAVSAVILAVVLVAPGLIPSRSQINKAKNTYREAHPRCVICQQDRSYVRGRTGKRLKIDIHHLIPEHVDMSIAADTNNFIGFCRRHHFMFGHGIGFGGSTSHHNTNLVATVRAVLVAFSNNAVFVKE